VVAPRGGRRDVRVPQEILDGLGEMSDPDRLHARERRFLRRVRRAQHPAEPRTEGALGCRDGAGDRANPPVEPQLAYARVLLEPRERDLRRGGEDRERDGEVETGALLAERRRREVDGDRATRPLEQGGIDPTPDTVLRLLTGAVCEPDDRERRQVARAQVRLDLDATRLEADERERDRAAQHGPTVRPNP
jgi:hypothetical protein